jgi:CPA1 family monovalent cation:H+ antiporter
MDHLQIVLVSLLVAVAGLSALASRLRVPYPILLVLGGLVMGFLPGLPQVQLNPDLVLVVFLPPLLYASAFFVGLRELRDDARVITLLSVGLVLATTVTVAVTVHAIVGGLPWAACFALGAIVAPTDAIAATTIARRLGLPRRLIAVIEGESLVNDASALVAYRVAVGAITGGTFSLFTAGGQFILAAVGGVAIGYVVARVIAAIRRRIDEPPVEITISLLSGYAAYIPAEAVGASGVLAAVTAGVALGWWAPSIVTPDVRQQGFAFWEVLSFLLNATLFVLIGLQLPAILHGLRGESPAWLIGAGAAVAGVVIGTRILWVNATTYVIRALDRRPAQRARRASWRLRMVTAWSGMRGAVSLAAALALPAETPQRDLLIFLTFSVILATLVLQGLTLPALIRALGVHADGTEEEREELKARLVATSAALERIDALAAEEWTRDDTIERMRAMYDYRRRRLKARAGKIEDDGYEDRSFAYQTMVREVLRAERAAILELRNQGTISNEVMHRLEREFDLEDQRLEI